MALRLLWVSAAVVVTAVSVSGPIQALLVLWSSGQLQLDLRLELGLGFRVQYSSLGFLVIITVL